MQFMFIFIPLRHTDIVTSEGSGVVSSPEWPHDFPAYSDYKCEWVIEVSSSYLIQLNFMDIDFSSYTVSCYDKTSIAWKGKTSIFLVC